MSVSEDPSMSAATDWTKPENARRLTVFRKLLGMFPPGRLIDLGAGDGRFSTEAADQGWEVVAVDARNDRRPDDPRLTWLEQDVRSVDLAGFDLILILGLFYHLTPTDQLDLLERCAGRPLIIDTHLDTGRSRHPLSEHRVEVTRGFEGRFYPEPETPLASVGNRYSFWPTRASFRRMLRERGFSVQEFEPEIDIDRHFFLALPIR
jgi:hypothetical protein